MRSTPCADGHNIVGQQLLTWLAQQCCVRLQVSKSLTGFKLCATTLNNTQQQATV